jgi:hypothetical protein
MEGEQGAGIDWPWWGNQPELGQGNLRNLFDFQADSTGTSAEPAGIWSNREQTTTGPSWL